MRGCIIVSPWEGDSGRYYPWNGEVHNTQALAEKNYNYARCFFSIGTNEKKILQEKLAEFNYGDWLADSIRAENIAAIRNDFSDYINQASFFKKNAWGYREWIALGCTSKTNYEALQKQEADLEKDEVVKSIFDMPAILS